MKLLDAEMLGHAIGILDDAVDNMAFDNKKEAKRMRPIIDYLNKLKEYNEGVTYLAGCYPIRNGKHVKDEE